MDINNNKMVCQKALMLNIFLLEEVALRIIMCASLCVEFSSNKFNQYLFHSRFSANDWYNCICQYVSTDSSGE